jgi:hypothetical protein
MWEAMTTLLILLLSLPVAALAIAVNGWTLSGVGPATLLVLAGLWTAWMEWLRHRSWLRHRDTEFIPGTQHLAVAGAFGWGAGIAAALIWLFTTLPYR